MRIHSSSYENNDLSHYPLCNFYCSYYTLVFRPIKPGYARSLSWNCSGQWLVEKTRLHQLVKKWISTETWAEHSFTHVQLNWMKATLFVDWFHQHSVTNGHQRAWHIGRWDQLLVFHWLQRREIDMPRVLIHSPSSTVRRSVNCGWRVRDLWCVQMDLSLIAQLHDLCVTGYLLCFQTTH